MFIFGHFPKAKVTLKLMEAKRILGLEMEASFVLATMQILIVGVIVGPNNNITWDPAIDKVKLSSRKPLILDYVVNFVKERSTKPCGRL